VTVTGAAIGAALSAIGARGGQIRSLDELAAGADAALRQAPPGLTGAGAASFLATTAQESAYYRTTREYGSGQWYAPWIGRGFVQVTHEANYRGFGAWCRAQGLVTDPDVFVNNRAALEDYRWAWLTATWYFAANNLWGWANAGDHLRVSQAVNGGRRRAGTSFVPNHWPERNAMFQAFRRAGDALLPSGAAPAAAPARPKVEPVIQNFPIVGSGSLELNTPIKGASGLYRAAYLSARSTAAGGTVDVWWGLSNVGGRGEAHWTLDANSRRWTALTGGDVDQATVHYNLGAGVPGAITVEFAPK